MGASATMAQPDYGRDSKLKHTLSHLDSLRLALRQSADEGHMLLWIDSVAREKLQRHEIDSAKYDRWREKLQRGDNILRLVDDYLAKRYNKKKYDTEYIGRPKERWTLKLMANMSLAEIETRTKAVDDNSLKVRSAARGTLAASASYRGIGLSLSINPGKLAGVNKDMEYNLTSYGNRFGYDISYMSANTYKGSYDRNGVETDIEKGLIKHSALNMNCYYAFNGRRFSFPAAFSQSYYQLKSCGSWMVGASAEYSITDIKADSLTGITATKIKVAGIALGGGYAYNYVAGRRWLLHISAMPTFNVYIHANTKSDDNKDRLKYKFPSLMLVGRGAAVYKMSEHRFLAASLVYNSSILGDKSHLQLIRSRWRVKIAYGIRF